MNDPGLEGVISTADDTVQGTLRMQEEVPQEQQDNGRRRGKRPRPQYSQDQEEIGLYQPTLWWFTSTAFPLIAGTFGPIANLFSVCALVQTWRVYLDDGRRVPDPAWLTALNACSLFLALCANIALLFNFARRIPYAVAQPITITLWYLSSILLAIPIGLTHNDNVNAFTDTHFMAFSQSYYYALISCIGYATISSLLLISTLGSTMFNRYPPSFSTLTIPQRTLMLQTISFSLYLALGAGIFATIEHWAFVDGIYWALYTLLTIGLGTDFPLTTVLGRMLLIPYAAFGIMLVGLVVSSVRGLVLERAKAKVVRRHLGKERERWERNIAHRRAHLHAMPRTSSLHQRFQEKRLMKLPQKLQQESLHALTHRDQLGKWHRAEFELMRYIERNAASTERYASLASSFVVILIVWSGGSLVFWSCEHNSQGWTYPDSLYFTYTTLLTIGYGDFYPNSSAGKPFFVLWSLISIPAMTVLISNMGDTVVKLVQDVTVWISKWTILPERDTRSSEEQSKQGRRHNQKHHRQRRVADHEESDASEHAHSDLERDIEHVGGEIEKFEEDEGTPNSLAARLSREISHLASDLSASPPKKYSWDEWTRWLDMLGERSDGSSSNHQDETEPSTPFPVMHVDAAVQPPPKAKSRASSQHNGVNAHGENGASPPCLMPASPSTSSIAAHHRHNQNPSRGSFDAEDRPTMAIGRRHSVDEQDRPGPGFQNLARSAASVSKDGHRPHWTWTWLSDDGPLFSRKTETEWIMERLCFRLEEVLEDEIRQARSSAPNHSSPIQIKTSRSRSGSSG